MRHLTKKLRVSSATLTHLLLQMLVMSTMVLDVVVSFWHEGQLAHMSFCTTSRSQNGITKIAVYEGWLLCSNWLQPIRSARQMPDTLWAERACTTALSTHAWGNPFVSIPPTTEAAYRGPAVEELCRCWMPSS